MSILVFTFSDGTPVVNRELALENVSPSARQAAEADGGDRPESVSRKQLKNELIADLKEALVKLGTVVEPQQTPPVLESTRL